MTRLEAAARLLDELEATVAMQERWRLGEIGFPGLEPEQVALRFVTRLRGIRQRILSLFADQVPLVELDTAELALGVHFGRSSAGKASRMRPPSGESREEFLEKRTLEERARLRR